MQESQAPRFAGTGNPADAIRQLIADVNVFDHLQALPLGGASQATGLLQCGAVKSLVWKDGGSQLQAKLIFHHFPANVRIRAEVDRLLFNCSCRMKPHEQVATVPCSHAASVLLLTHAFAKQQGADSIQLPHGDYDRLRQEFDGVAARPGRPGGNVPAPTSGVVVVNLATEAGENPFSYRRDGFPGHFEVRREVASFVGRWALAENSVKHFEAWLQQPSSLELEVVAGKERIPVEHQPAVPLRGSSELELRGTDVVLRQRLARMDGDAPLGKVELVADRLMWLPESRRFGWVEEIERELLSNAVVEGLGLLSGCRAAENIISTGTGYEIHISHRDWNRLLLRWPPKGLRKEETDPLLGDPSGSLPESDFTLHLDISEHDVDRFRFDLRMKARGTELDYIQYALEAEEDVLDDYGYRQLVRKQERRELLVQAFYRILAAPNRKSRAEIVAEVAEAAPISRLSMGPVTARHLFRLLEEEYCQKGKATLHVSTAAGHPEWFQLLSPLARVAEAILSLRQAVPELQPVTDPEASAMPSAVPSADRNSASVDDFDPDFGAFDHGIWDEFDEDDEEEERRVLVAPKAEAMSRFATLVEVCHAAGIELTFEAKAVETVRLDLSVRATQQEGMIDWFELTPEVTRDGSSIPQEHWEAWVRGQLIRDADGRMRVIHPDSKAAFEKFRNILRLHAEEDRRGKKRKGTEPLQVPRLRIFDWLALQNSGVRCDIPAEAATILKSLSSFDAIPEIPLPQGLRATLRPYQIDGYRWLAFLYRHRFGACLADDMGLGKTLQAITLLGAVKEGLVGEPSGSGAPRPPHLIVLPPTLLFNWHHEIATFFPDLKVVEMTGSNRRIDEAEAEADVILTTYELARRDILKLEKREFDVIVFDEAQAIKNLTASRSKAMRRLKGRFKVCLTGTPVENHAGEYYSILELALPGLFGDYSKFMAALRQPEGFDPLPRARPFVMRRTKAKILPELPPKVETDVWLQLSDTQKGYYTRAVAEVKAEVLAAFQDKTSAQAGIVALSALTRLRQICISPALLDADHAEISPKIEHLIAKLFELKEEGHAALVFSQFTRALDLLGVHLQARELDYVRIDGTTPMKDRKARVAGFQGGEGPGIFLISLKTGGVGLNLTRASYVFHLDPWWNPAVENQASDRAHRIGQEQHVFVNRLLMRHTVEEKMMMLKARKRGLFDEVLGGAENRSGASLLTRDDMSWLLDE